MSGRGGELPDNKDTPKMNENETSEQETRLPAQQTQQPQPASNPGGKELALQEAARDSDRQPVEAGSNAAPDDARFSAGVVKLYEALLKEPIPEEMLRLVEELSKQERN
jgi:hypothetical protein